MTKRARLKHNFTLPPGFGEETAFDRAVKRSLAEEKACAGIPTAALEQGAVQELVEAARYYRMLAQAQQWPIHYNEANISYCDCGQNDAATPGNITHTPACCFSQAEAALAKLQPQQEEKRDKET